MQIETKTLGTSRQPQKALYMGQNSIEYSNEPLSHFTWTTKYSEYQHLRRGNRISLFRYTSFKIEMMYTFGQ